MARKVKEKEEKAKTEVLPIHRIEPLSWWIGMKTPLQLMIYGKDLKGSKVTVKGKGVSIKKVHQAESPNYLFIDIEIASTAKAGEYIFEIKNNNRVATFNYLLEKRRRGSAERKSFSSEDLVYLLMPDRFANGNPANDSTPDTTEKAKRRDPFGRHGGDLQGIIDHLDYLKELGVTTLWPTPPQLDNEKSQSYHGYASGDYYRIDPRFGDNELYRKMVEEAHKKDIKVIMDAVPNHCGTAHWWMKDLPFKDWVHMKTRTTASNYRLATITDPNISKLDRSNTVDGWFDQGMPDIGIENPYTLQYLLQVYIWWIEWANLDGLRVDTFPYNDKNAIAEWTRRILEEYPNLNIVAECWHSSAAIVSYWQGTTKNNDGYNSYLPSVMDFPLQEALNEGIAAEKFEWNTGTNRIYEAMALDFLYPNVKSLLIFLDNHDTERFADTVRGNIKRIKIGLTFLATLRGIPQLYYGTEYGFRSTDMTKGHGTARKDFPGG
ncbi:MAG: cyclomaltodextrinase N-terminal domain-containing protein [Candidatus Azobacteroides sp.]|nr:cyclomaltodextrinase N-terminal domain-containing protein [Candidatus Azobacteroides sp.]